MYCKSCGERIIGTEKECPKCGEPVHSGLDIPENQVESTGEYTYVKPKSKLAIFYDKLCEKLGTLVGIAIVIMLIWYFQIWPHHIYKVGCDYLKDKVFTSETEYKFKKYNKNYIAASEETKMLDFGEGKMSYHQFYLAIPVTLESDEMGKLEWVYKMEIYVHPFGEDGVFKKSRYVRCSGQPTWIEEMQDLFNELESETEKSIDECLEDMDLYNYAETTEEQLFNNETEYESKDIVYNTPIKTTDLAGIYGALEGNDILTINMYSSPEGDEVGNFDYCGNSGVIVDQNGQYILYGECNMVMDVMRNANGVIQVTLWADTGGEKYCDLIMLKHFRS